MSAVTQTIVAALCVTASAQPRPTSVTDVPTPTYRAPPAPTSDNQPTYLPPAPTDNQPTYLPPAPTSDMTQEPPAPTSDNQPTYLPPAPTSDMTQEPPAPTSDNQPTYLPPAPTSNNQPTQLPPVPTRAGQPTQRPPAPTDNTPAPTHFVHPTGTLTVSHYQDDACETPTEANPVQTVPLGVCHSGKKYSCDGSTVTIEMYRSADCGGSAVSTTETLNECNMHGPGANNTDFVKYTDCSMASTAPETPTGEPEISGTTSLAWAAAAIVGSISALAL